jgi:hypothetical protein
MLFQKCNVYTTFYICQNCRASDKYAVSICFSTECASYNGNHPIRYCQQCHNIRHNNRRGGDHIVHTSLPQLWDMDAEVQTYMVESIVRYSILNYTECIILVSHKFSLLTPFNKL